MQFKGTLLHVCEVEVDSPRIRDALRGHVAADNNRHMRVLMASSHDGTCADAWHEHDESAEVETFAEWSLN